MTDPAQMNRGLEALIGRVLADRYRVDSLLGLGAMGAVFRGCQLTLKRDVAIKILHPELLQDEQIAKRFEREAESAARLEHPNIVQVLEQGTTEDGFKFIVMQLLEGGELADRLHEPLPPAQATIWAIQIFAALEHAHSHGIIHRDLKPENVFVSHDHDGREVLKLVDFGIAKIVGGPDSGEPMTKLGLVFGTPAYMSPEQATGVEIDERTDLYSAGVILYQMLAGAPPFRNDDPVALIRMQVSLDPPPLPEDVPAEIAGVVFKLLAKQREERFATAAECREVLEAILPGLDLEGVAIPSHIVRDVSGVVSGASMPIAIPAASGRVGLASTGSRGRGRWIVVGVLALAGLGSAAWFLRPMLSGSGEAEASESADDGAAPAPVISSVPADDLAEIDRLLLAKSGEPALGLIKPLQDNYPQDPQLAWREGKALALSRSTRDTALVRYGEAFDADPSLIKDAAFYSELYELLGDRRLRTEAVDFALQKLGPHGHNFLLELVNEKNPERALRYTERKRALAELSTVPGSNALVNHELNLARDLWQAPQAAEPCAAYRDALQAISVAPNGLYLATLRNRALPKKPANEDDAAICTETAPFQEQVLAAYEAAYGEGAQPEPEPEPEPAESTKKKTSSSKKKSASSKKKSKKQDPFDKMGKKLDKLFGG